MESKFKNMTVSEIQNHRDECSEKITEAVKEFEDKTGLSVSDVLNYDDGKPFGSGGWAITVMSVI